MHHSGRDTRILPPKRLSAIFREVARTYQARAVVPHCPVCRKACCRLDQLVLELDWSRLRLLWDLNVSRRAFDAALERGEGPAEIRAQEGLYYVHGRVCPAYRRRRCSVYGSRLKPPGCEDFPVYEQDGALVADLRCEAVELDALEASLRRAFGIQVRLTAHENLEFPFLVSFRARPRRVRARRRTSRRRA